MKSVTSRLVVSVLVCIVLMMIFNKLINMYISEDFNGYWVPRNSRIERDFRFKGKKMYEKDKDGNETTYRLIDTMGSYEIDPKSIDSDSFFADASTVEIVNSGDTQYINIDFDEGGSGSIKLYRADKSDTYFANHWDFFKVFRYLILPTLVGLTVFSSSWKKKNEAKSS